VLRIIIFLSVLLGSSLLIFGGCKGCSGSGGVPDLEGSRVGAIV